MKRAWKYIAHFWYVAINWNIWMAFFMVYDNIRGAIKYGFGTFLPSELTELAIVRGDRKAGSRYEPVSFYMLEHLFKAFRKLSGEASLVDLGCGKGRVLMAAPHFQFTDVTGIDFAKELCREAIANMMKKSEQFPGLRWRVLNENVEEYNIERTDSVFFMFNPFNQVVLKTFMNNLDSSCRQFPRRIYCLYASPQHQAVLMDNGFAVVFQRELMHLKGIILVRD